MRKTLLLPGCLTKWMMNKPGLLVLRRRLMNSGIVWRIECGAISPMKTLRPLIRRGGAKRRGGLACRLIRLRDDSSVQRIGRQQGLDVERHLMLRQVRRRFGETVATYSAPWLARIAEPAVLEDLGEALLDCADGAAWLARLESMSMANKR